ncbi:MAG: 2Fe-2S iron-sulfur cluster-binding protein [Pseudomonadota bacterium]
MSHPYYDLAFTPTVCALQERDGSRAHYGGADDAPGDARLGPQEVAFIEAADHFFQASVGETGWPYVQHRGGPAGFLKVLDARTIGFADLAGNRQFISLGNLTKDGRIALIIMDWVCKRRLKLMGRVRIADDAATLARLAVPGQARVERAYLISVEGYDWNCPQHITQRYTRASVERALAPLRQQVEDLQRALSETARPAPLALGQGPLHLTVSALRQVSPTVRAYTLVRADGAPLPPVAPGAHLEVPVRLPDGQEVLRHYSIMPAPGAGAAWEIAVQRALRRGAPTQGAASAIHAQWTLGLSLRVAAPRNHFALHEDARPALLLAAGIGVTPIRTMAIALQAQGRPYAFHFGVRDHADAALAAHDGTAVQVYASADGARMDVAALIGAAPDGTVVYACGPEAFIAQATAAAGARGLVLCVERFAAAAPREGERAFSVTLANSGKVLTVAPGTSILEAVERAGVRAPAACRTGDCRTCATTCLEGEPEHRDHCLSAHAKEQDKQMCICVSRAQGAALTLAL